MRLTQLRDLVNTLNLTNSFPVLEPQRANTVANLVKFREVVAQLSAVPGFSEQVNWFKGSEIFKSTSENVQDPQAGLFLQRATVLLSTIHAFASAINEIAPLAPLDSIRIRLPDSTDFPTVIEDQATLSTCLQQIVLREGIGGRIEIQGWETGSLWICLGLGSIVAVRLVGTLAWSAAVVRKKKLECQAIELHLRNIEAQTTTLEHVSEKHREVLDRLVEAEALSIFDAEFPGQRDPEYVERLKMTLRTLSDLMIRGAQIHPALLEPEKADNVFPDYSSLDTIASRILQLGDKK